ncbi:MAG: histidine--tRNA ligase family protein [Candidatus Hydrogenedentota bacterium]|nr:MAG: histidine--tRNA ligase family protein [Candidatus Hydrogenedentota bacterium]
MLSTKPYKGSRDFYPEEMRSREWIFSKLSKTAELFGYEKVDAPLIEPVDLYLAKTSEEIVNQQIYSFEDRGGRQVAIRPEMTPTVSRMIAARYRELVKPIRWYSIPNLWRYERPGKGRLREHWQLNCDLFAAADEFLADLEILSLAMEIPLAFDAPLGSFRLYINHRKILNAFLEKFLQIPKEKHAPVARLMDKKEKLPKETWLAALQEEGLLQEQAEKIAQYMESGISFLKEHKDNLDKEATFG